MNTLALNPDYAAQLFEVREMVAEVRLIKVGDESDLIEAYAVESTYGYYIVDAGSLASAAEMLVQQPERVDQDRELILGFKSLEAVNFLRATRSLVSRYCRTDCRWRHSNSQVLPSAFAIFAENLEFTHFPVVPISLVGFLLGDLAI